MTPGAERTPRRPGDAPLGLHPIAGARNIVRRSLEPAAAACIDPLDPEEQRRLAEQPNKAGHDTRLSLPSALRRAPHSSPGHLRCAATPRNEKSTPRVRLGSERPLGERSAGAGTFQTIGARRPIGATVQARSGWSIPPRHSVRVPLPDSMGPTAHTLPLQHAHPQSGVALARSRATSRPGTPSSARAATARGLSRVSSSTAMESLLSSTMPIMRSSLLAPDRFPEPPQSPGNGVGKIPRSCSGPTIGMLSLGLSEGMRRMGLSEGTGIPRSMSLLALNRLASPVDEAARTQDDKTLIGLSLLEVQPDWAVSSAELELGERIGVGTFGIVFRARWRGVEVAVKQLRLSSSASSQQERERAFVCEMNIMAGLQHPNVAQFLGGCVERGHVSMVHELCLHSLHDVLHGHAVVHPSLLIPLALQLKWAREIALGVAYLHAQRPPVVHRDLKAGNVLVCKAWCAKLADFGAARVRASKHIETARTSGTSQWTAPELCLEDDYTQRPRFQQIESTLQSAQNIFLRDADADTWRVELPPISAGHAVSANGPGVYPSGVYPSGDGSDFGGLAERLLQALLARSRELLGEEALAFKEDRSRAQARPARDSADSTDVSGSDSDLDTG
ncbi:kinase-like domain-containing protein [Pavlovales sp. CCMP2436]|nr:kinase-like domain-containing protein [Pavlovales sp. CCMP2436]